VKPYILIIETSDYDTFPIGGQFSFAKNMVKIFKSELALAGAVADNTPIGQWMQKTINGVQIPFFPYLRIPSKMNNKPLIPYRLQTYMALKRQLSRIRSLGVLNVFIQCPEIMMAISSHKWDSVCFRFPGVQDEMKYSRYFWARYLSLPFNLALQKSIQSADLVLASADKGAIDEVVMRSRGRLKRDKIISFPTRVDTDFFSPMDKKSCRDRLNISNQDFVVISCTRLAWSKGWELVFDSFVELRKKRSKAKLIFVGDGEDRDKLERRISKQGLKHEVLITGVVDKTDVPFYLNAADVYVVGSYREGWSNSMLEALACALPIVTTNVSGAAQMVASGKNGFIVDNRDHVQFSEAIINCSELPEAGGVSLRIVQKYSLKNLKSDLLDLWKIIPTI
jgi:glycosyltransferase involved in cell wall biosynthesis